MKGPRFKYLFYNLITVVVILAVTEIVCRVVLYKVYNRDFEADLIIDKKYLSSAGLKPNVTGTVWGKIFNTDNFGARKNAKVYNTKKKKWLFIGDSVTEGVGVEDSSTFSYRVSETALGDSFNIINLSLIGYSTYDYLNVLQSLLAGGDTDIARVSVFYCLNDVYGKHSGLEGPGELRPGFVKRVSHFLQANYYTYRLLKLYWFRHADNYYRYDRHFYAKDNYYFLSAMGQLNYCDSLCKAHNISFSITALPYRSQLVKQGDDSFTPQKMVGNYCTQHGISYNYVSDICKGDNCNNLYLFADEIHFSELGHKVIADFLLSH